MQNLPWSSSGGEPRLLQLLHDLSFAASEEALLHPATHPAHLSSLEAAHHPFGSPGAWGD